MGGMVAAIERGWVQREIEDAAYRQQQAVDSGERRGGRGQPVYRPERNPGAAARSVAEGTVERDQIERVRALRIRRDPVRWRAALDRVTDRPRCSS